MLTSTSYPDIKGYLCLLGTTTLNRVVWFYDSSQSDDELSPDDLAKKRETDAAVRRGVQLLIGLREKGEGCVSEEGGLSVYSELTFAQNVRASFGQR